MDDELAQALREWARLPYPRDDYPPGSPRGEIRGVDLALLDGDIGVVAYDALDGRLSASDMISLEHSIRALTSVMPELSQAGQAYFGPALEILAIVMRR